MSDIDPNEFTAREKFILEYHRTRQLASSHRIFGYNTMFVAASIGCVAWSALREDPALGFVGYMLLLGRLYYLVTEGGRATKDYSSIFAKYEAKLKALTETLKKKESGAGS